MSEAHRVYEAVQQDKPFVPMSVTLGSGRSVQNVTETALLNPYSAALQRILTLNFKKNF